MNASKSVPQARPSARGGDPAEWSAGCDSGIRVLAVGQGVKSQQRRVRIQVILTAFVVVANLIGIAVASLVVTVAFLISSVFEPEVRWITFAVVQAYIAAAL